MSMLPVLTLWEVMTACALLGLRDLDLVETASVSLAFSYTNNTAGDN